MTVSIPGGNAVKLGSLCKPMMSYHKYGNVHVKKQGNFTWSNRR